MLRKTAVVGFCLLLLLQIQNGSTACTHSSIIINPWPDDVTGDPKIVTIAGITGAILSGTNSTDSLDASLYVNISVNVTSGELVLEPMQTLYGLRDYPADKRSAQLKADCAITCGAESGSFSLTVLVKDANTAPPIMQRNTYTASVPETLPSGFSLPDIKISANDADLDSPNNVLTFALSDSSVFQLSDPVRTADAEATYTSQLILHQPLDWSQQQQYQLTVTVQDGGGMTSSASINITVSDVDNKQPKFTKSVYTADVTDPEAVGPLSVEIKAEDPDTGGPLIYQLTDPVQDRWLGYFDISSPISGAAVLNLKKDITDRLLPTPSTVTLLLEAEEKNGVFSCRSVVVITLPAQLITTTTEPPTSTSTMAPTSSSTSPTTSPSTSPTTSSTTPQTSPETSPTPSPSPSTTAESSTVPSSTTPATSPTTPAPTPQPCQQLIFNSREIYATAAEKYNGVLLTVEANPSSTVGPVTYRLLTPSFDDYMSLNATTGELSKIDHLNHQTVSLLVQGVFSGNPERNQTNRTDVVLWDEVLIIITISDDNDHRPDLAVSIQRSSHDNYNVVGYRKSPESGYPQYLATVTATDGDTGVYGSDGVVFSTQQDFVSVDDKGIVYLVKEPSSNIQHKFSVIGRDNKGKMPFMQGSAEIMIVPVSDQQLFYVTSDNQLTDPESVTSLLDDVRRTGNYEAVYAYGLPTTTTSSYQNIFFSLLSATNHEKSQIVIYAVQAKKASANNSPEFEAVQKESMQATISKMSGAFRIKFSGTQKDHAGCAPAPDDTTKTALIAVSIVLGVLFVLVSVVSITLQLRARRNRYRSASDLEPLNNSGGNSAIYPPKNTTATSGPEGASGTAAFHSERIEPSQEEAPFHGSHVETYNNAGYLENQEHEERGSYNLDLPITQDDTFVTASAPAFEDTSPSGFPPMTDTLPPPESPAPISSEDRTLLSLSQPISANVPSSEPISVPDEPKPDYSTKTVGFNETVLCLHPEITEEEDGEEEAVVEDEEEETPAAVDTPIDQLAPSLDAAESGTSQVANEAPTHLYPSLDGLEKPVEDEVDQL